MSNYIARVELHAATYDDYERLHAYMQQRGYARVVKSDTGITYQLPTGTYVSTASPVEINTALEAAASAASATGKKSSVIVANWSSAQWQGLTIVNAARAR